MIQGELPVTGEIYLKSGIAHWEPLIMGVTKELCLSTHITIRPTDKVVVNKEKVVLNIIVKKIYPPFSMPPILPFFHIESVDDGLNYFFNSYFKNFFENLEDENVWILNGYLKDFQRKIGIFIIYNQEKKQATYFLTESVFYPDCAIN